MSSEKKERSFVIDAIILCVITLVLGGILAGVYTMTKGTIAQRQADTDSKACEKVIASVDGATVADAGDDAVAQANDFLTKHILNSSKKVEEEQSESYSKYVNVTTVKKLQVNGSDAGYVYIADAKKGYGGSISFVLGVYNGTVTGIEITSQSETAGLGAEIKDSKAWQDLFKGKKIFSADGAAVAIAVKKASDVKNPASEVDAVTGATLTSDGVSLMLQECFSKYVTFLKK